jgi:hypothetical protein
MSKRLPRLGQSAVVGWLILATCLLSVAPHRHAIAAAPCEARDGVHAPRPDPCLEPGVRPASDDTCVVCCFLRLLSSSEIATCSFGIPCFLTTRVSVASRATFGAHPTRDATPRAPPAV